MTGTPGDASPVEVLVWTMEVEAPEDEVPARWRAWLSPEEEAQAARFRRRGDAVTYLAAHALTRRLLAEMEGRASSEWRFVRGPFGKPAIDPALGSNLKFNLSHTNGLVAAAACTGDDVGVDVEACDRRPPEPGVAERYFSPREVVHLRGCAGDRVTDTFFQFWTLKESYIKATGEGLSRPLRSFTFQLDPAAITFDPGADDDPSHWQFFQARPTARHLLAVSLRRPATQPATFSWRALRYDDL